LVIDGNPSTKIKYAESRDFIMALDPYFDQRFGYRSSRINIDEIGSARFEDYDMVVLMNVEAFENTGSPDQPKYPKLQELEDYVANGCGLVIYTGNQCSKSFYAGPFYREGNGLCPLKITEVETPDTFFRVKSKSILSHPIFPGETGKKSAIGMAIGLVRFYSITKTENPMDSSSALAPTILARFNDPEDSPAIAERTFGSEGGKVVMVLSSGGMFAGEDKWNDWANDGSGSFVVVCQDLASYMARKIETRYTAAVGEPISYVPDARFGSDKATLTRYPSTDLGGTAAKLKAFEIVKRLELLAGYLEEKDHSDIEKLKSVTLRFSKLLDEITLPVTDDQQGDIDRSIADLKGVLSGLDVSGEPDLLLAWLNEPVSNIMRNELRWNTVKFYGEYSVDPDRSDMESPEGSRSVLFARNPDPEEGKLTPAGGREEIEDYIGPVKNYSRRVGDKAEQGDVSATLKTELWMYLVGAMVLLMALELLLGQRFGHYGQGKSTSRA